MPARGLGGGILEGLMYQQQRKDQLDQQAQEMALRNAQQRLQQDEFTRLKNNDVISAKQHDEELQLRKDAEKYRRERDTKEDEQKNWRNAFDWTGKLYTQGLPGALIAPSADAVRAGDPFTFKEEVAKLPVSPQFKEKTEAAIRTIKARMDLAEQKAFDTIYEASVKGGREPQEAMAEAQAVILGRRMNPNFLPQSPQAQPLAPIMGGDPSAVNPLLQQMGIVDPAASAQPGNGAMPGLPQGVLPRVQAQIDATKAGTQSKQAYAAKTRQDTQQKAQMFPQEMNLKLAKIAESEARRAQIRASTERILKFMPYEEMLKAAQIKTVTTREQVDAFNLEQKQNFARWQKQSGYGSEAQMKTAQKAAEFNARLSKDQSNLKKELEVAKQFMVKMRVLEKMPDLPKEDKNYQTVKYQREFAMQHRPDAENRVRQIYQSISDISRMKNQNATFINYNIQRTDTTGKPFSNNPPAITTPQTGNSALPKITPPPGVRPNTYLKDKRQMQLGKVGDQRTKKPDYSKMSDAELKAALARKLQGK